MRFSIPSSKEDEESLLPPSPTASRPTAWDVVIGSATKWRSLLRIMINLLQQLASFTVPSFLRRSPTQNTSSEKTAPPLASLKKHSTEYLDGVRGVASFIVFIFHWTHIHYPGVNSGYGYGKNKSIWQLPMIRFVYSGASMVAIFFVVSGYVLTHRFVQKMHRHEYESLFAGLTSLTFRRALRLFLPAFFSSMLAYLCVSGGLIDVPTEIDGRKFHHGLPALLRYLDMESSPWTWDAFMKGFYNAQLWSISLEFRGSMVVFLMILGLARTRTSVRILVELIVCAHAFGHRRWDVALFVVGMTIAEADVLLNTSSSWRARVQRKRAKLIMWIMILVGIYLAGYPRDHATESLGYGFARNVWPFTEYRRRFWLSIGSILIVAPMPFLPGLQSFFCLGLIRYIGKISFALYLIHGLGNQTIGKWIMVYTWTVLGKTTTSTYASSYVVSSLLYFPIIIWWSDMYWRAIDIPATNFAKWLEAKCRSSALT